MYRILTNSKEHTCLYIRVITVEDIKKVVDILRKDRRRSDIVSKHTVVRQMFHSSSNRVTQDLMA